MTASADGLSVSVPHVLREYALLADGERGILVGPRGDFTWMWFPGWDGDGRFSSMIGGAGAYARRRGLAGGRRDCQAVAGTGRRGVGDRPRRLGPQPTDLCRRLRAISARHPAAERIAGWLTLADRITADTAAKALHRSGRRQRSPGDERLDAALLLVAIRGAIPPTIPARSRPWPRSSTAWSRMATATATVPTSDCLAGQKGRLCYAGS